MWLGLVTIATVVEGFIKISKEVITNFELKCRSKRLYVLKWISRTQI